MKTKVEIIYAPDTSTTLNQPYYEARVSAGFPSPAGDYEEGRLDLNRDLIKNPAATFFVRVRGDSMVGAGIHQDDILVVDRSLDAKSGNVVIAVVDGELTVKRIRIRRKKLKTRWTNVPPAKSSSAEKTLRLPGLPDRSPPQRRKCKLEEQKGGQDHHDKERGHRRSHGLLRRPLYRKGENSILTTLAIVEGAVNTTRKRLMLSSIS
ncbi:MAG: LexA family protein [Planctomycetota bacterium]|jgi:DNA polymerase V